MDLLVGWTSGGDQFLLKFGTFLPVKYDYKQISEELISKAGIPRGEIFDYEYSPYKAIFERFFQFCQQNLTECSQDYNIQPAKLYYREAYGVNARAGVQNGYYIIGVNKETIARLYDLFYNRNNIFEEDSDLLPYAGLNQSPDTPLGILMFQTACLFTYYHEHGHLIQKSPQLTFGLNEHYKELKEEEYSQEKHVLEFDADLGGAQLICFHLIDYWKKQQEAFRTEESFQRLLSVGAASIFSYFMLLSTTRQPIYYKKAEHPHPVVRISYIMDCFIKVAQINLPEGVNIKANLALTEGFKIADKFFRSVFALNIVEGFAAVYETEAADIERYVTELIALSKANPNLVRHKIAFPKKE
jgi:hypothetical protein